MGWGLSGLVVFSADDQYVLPFGRARLRHAGLRRKRLNSHVMVRVKRVPVECGRDRPMRYDGADGVAHVGGLFGVDRQEVVDRRIRRHHDGIGGDDPAVCSLDPRRLTARDGLCMRPGEDASSGTLNGRSDRGQVLKRVELRLARKSQTRPRIEVQ